MTFIIAEVSSNWTSFEDAKDSITMAKNVGADAVKFQLFTPESLFGFDLYDLDPTPEYFEIPNPTWERISEYAMLPEWLPKLAEKANACGIEFMCSAFSPELLKLVDPYVKRHKIASAELTYRELLEAAKATGKPVLLSTGGSSITDIKMALDLLWKPGESDVTLMYCVSAYPAKNVNLFSIDRLKDEFKRSGAYLSQLDFGYSCHTDEWYTPVCAVKYHGAIVIEKHFKLRDMNTPDSPHSLNPEEFKEMVDVIRGKADHISFPEPQERQMLRRHNRRLCAINDVAAGESLQYGVNFGCYRSLREDTEGLHGFADQAVNGKTCKVALKAGDPITPKHVEL